MLNTLFWRLAGLSLACSAVLAPLLLASRLIRRRYSARTCYMLWLLLAVRLLLPLPAARSQRAVRVEVPRYELTLAGQTPMDPGPAPAKSQAPMKTGNSVNTGDAAPTPGAGNSGRTISLTALLPGLWLAGALIWGLWLTLSYALARRALLRRVRPGGGEDEALLDALRRELGCKDRPALYRSDRVSTPMLVGLLRPAILLPAGEPEGEELSLMLRHELTHLRRRDVAYKLVLQLTCAVHWFNPLVWWMSREAGGNLELCCDEDVIRGRDSAFRRTYGDILLKTAAGTGRTPALSARMGGGKGYLKARLSNLFVKKKRGAALACAVLAAALLGGSLVFCTGEEPGMDPAASSSPAPSGDPQEELEGVPAESDRDAVQALLDSISVSNSCQVSVTIPLGRRETNDWEMEIRGRMEVDGVGGMSLHCGFNPTELVPGQRVTRDFSKEWSDITDLFLLVKLGEEAQDVDLLALAPDEAGGIAPSEPKHAWYVRDAGGFGGDFSVRLTSDGRFSYYAGMLSSYIGLGTWTWDGETLCLADEGLRDSVGIQYFYFTLDGGDLIFQAEHSAQFMYVDVADGERFSLDSAKSTMYLGEHEPAAE